MGGVPYLYGWVVDESFDTGHSKGSEGDGDEKSSTFGNPPLGSARDFKVVYVEVWMVKERVLTDAEIEEREYQEAKKKKKVGRSVLAEEDNADKVIAGFMGTHNFTHYSEDLKKEKKDDQPQ
eukprot:gene15863-18849_t